MHTKRFNTFFKRWVQFRLGAIPRLVSTKKTRRIYEVIKKEIQEFDVNDPLMFFFNIYDAKKI